jgi:hypothetical protein
MQLLVEDDPPDLARLNNVGERLFAARRVGEWSLVVHTWPEWESL